MDTKGIDLTKCVNLRFRLRIDGTNYFGRIETDERGRNCLFCDDGKAYWIADSSDELQRYGKSDFEIVPRDPGTYKDWQVGDLIVNRDGCTGQIIFRSGDFVAANIGGCMCYTCEEMHGSGWRLVLTDIEQQIIEEKKKYEPKDGDVVAWKDKEDDGNPAVSIYKEGNRGYATIFANGLTECSTYATFAMNIVRPATDEEKQRLFDAMSKEGKRWNAEKKVVEDIPKPYEFKKGEPVLVRDYENKLWRIAAYDSEDKKGFLVNTGKSVVHWKQCIPYNERTMHLLGTYEDYKEGE